MEKFLDRGEHAYLHAELIEARRKYPHARIHRRYPGGPLFVQTLSWLP